jgi:autotransporter-associated beta strand protein
MRPKSRLLAIAAAVWSSTPLATYASNTVGFSMSDPGVTRSVAEWGIDAAWPSYDNVRLSFASIGANNVDMVRMTYDPAEALIDNGNGTYSLNAIAQQRVNDQLALAGMSGTNKPLTLVPGEFGGTYNAVNWVRTIKTTQEYINSGPGWTSTPIKSIEVFNEPDFWGGEGSPADLNSAILQLKAYPVFQNTAFPVGSTLASTNATFWYDNAPAGTAGSSHLLGGSLSAWAGFIDHVKATGKPFTNPELHSLGEAIVGAEHGMASGMFWADTLRARGLFMQASDGKRLGYYEDLGRQSAAAVYRAPNGKTYAFAGGLERFGAATSYRFVSNDRDAYVNGYRVREYMLQTKRDEDSAINPAGDDFQNYGSWSAQGAYADVETGAGLLPLDGYRWKIVNTQTSQVMEVVGSGTGDGALIRNATDADGLNQKWDIVRTRTGYFELFNANSGRTAEVANGSLANNASVRQWGTADNSFQQWYIEDNGNGTFVIRNAFTNKYLTGNTSNNIQQDNVAPYASFQNWRFVLANPNTPATSRYNFEGNVNDSAGTNHGTANGAPTYASGPSGSGQAINLNGTTSYMQLPSGVANSSNITISTYVKWDGGNAWQRIFDFGDDTTTYMMLTPKSGDNTMRFAITTTGSGGEQTLDTAALPTGQWVHLTLTLGGNTGVLYVDGKPRVAGQILLDPSHISPTLNYIGKSQFADPLFDGMIDDFRIYDYALDPGQVGSLVFNRWTGALNSSWTTAIQSGAKNWQHDLAATDYSNGGNLLFDDYATSFAVSVTDATVTPASVQFDNRNNAYTLSGPGAVAGSTSITKNGAGALTITSANTYTGGTILNGGTLNINHANAIGTGPLTIAGGATLNNTSGAAITLATNNTQTWDGDFAVGGTNPLNMGSGAITLTGDRTVTVNGTGAFTVGAIGQSGGARQLTKAGSGTMFINGNSTYTGNTSVNGGTLTIGGTLSSSPTINVNSGSLVVNGSLTASGNVSVGQGDGGVGNLSVQSGGSVTANTLLIGAGGSPTAVASGTGTLASGGSISTSQWFVLGQSGAAPSSGAFTVNGGTLNVHTNAAATGNLEVGTYDATTATLNINAGSNVKLLNNALLVFGAQGNHSGSGVVNHNGGNVTFYSDGGSTVGGTGRLVLASNANPSGSYTYNLNGGTLSVSQVLRENTAGSPTTVFNFNGGTLKPATNQAAFLNGLTRSNVRNGGAVIDSNGFNITIAQPLVHSNVAGDNAIDGGLTKNGSGTLTLNGVSTYTGTTIAAAGKLLLNVSLITSSSLQATGGTIELASGLNKIIKTNSITINNAGRIDLQDNKLAVVGGNLAAITNLLATGRNGGTWDGFNGIMTSQPAADTNYTALGLGTASAGQVFGGQTMNAGDVLLMYTYGGDATLDGKINVDDYIKIDSGIAAGLSGWSNGDFNYDGKINIDDYTTQIDANIGNQNGYVFPTAAGIDAGGDNGVTSVPEPSFGLMICAVTAWPLSRRCRRPDQCGI